MRSLVAITLGLGLAASLVACEDSPPSRDMAQAPMQDMASGPDFAAVDLGGPVEFADFVLSLINTQTADNTLPTTTEDKTFVDSMQPSKFAPLFP